MGGWEEQEIVSVGETFGSAFLFYRPRKEEQGKEKLLTAGKEKKRCTTLCCYSMACNLGTRLQEKVVMV